MHHPSTDRSAILTAAAVRLQVAGPAAVVSGDSILPPGPALAPSCRVSTLADARDVEGGWA